MGIIQRQCWSVSSVQFVYLSQSVAFSKGMYEQAVRFTKALGLSSTA